MPFPAGGAELARRRHSMRADQYVGSPILRPTSSRVVRRDPMNLAARDCLEHLRVDTFLLQIADDDRGPRARQLPVRGILAGQLRADGDIVSVSNHVDLVVL